LLIPKHAIRDCFNLKSICDLKIAIEAIPIVLSNQAKSIESHLSELE